MLVLIVAAEPRRDKCGQSTSFRRCSTVAASLRHYRGRVLLSGHGVGTSGSAVVSERGVRRRAAAGGGWIEGREAEGNDRRVGGEREVAVVGILEPWVGHD
jgi:hypothetical protein